MDMIYYKNKVNGEIYEVNNIHRKDDAFYYVFNNEFKKENSSFYKSYGKNIDLYDEDVGSIKLEFFLIYDSINLNLTTHFSWDFNNIPFIPKIIELTNQNLVISDSSIDLYYLFYKRICDVIDINMAYYNIPLEKFNFDNGDIFEIISEDCKEVKDLKVRNHFR
ncbi:hypothetical protein UFVDC4_00027 [Staphylococcus phage vB_SauM-UFV_DC4]|nr:hypothetical protein UFVDC4_00027 [Staphylococcus phage vB_SauM-UFV_DC4]